MGRYVGPICKTIGDNYPNTWFIVYKQERAVFTTYLLITCLLVVSEEVVKAATELTTMVGYGTKAQQRNACDHLQSIQGASGAAGLVALTY